MSLNFVLRLALPTCAFLCLAACGGGSKLVRHPAQDAESMLQAPAAAQASDERLRASFHAVVLRNGPGSWARNAHWDEYYLQVTNLSASPVQITGAAVVDSHGTRLPSLDDRKQLERESDANAKRYRQEGIEITAGPGSASLLLAGAGMTVAGVGTAVGAAYGSMLGGGTAAGATAAASALMLVGPAFAIAGIVRAVHNGQVGDELARRAADFPLVLAPGETRALDLFLPLAPAPTRIELDYEAGSNAGRLPLDLQVPLAGLHLPATGTAGAR
jgi:hypothetical protein